MKPSFRISNFFPFKDRVPKRIRSGVVYKFTCPSCQVGYIGKTDRHLHTRFCEHAGISELTGKAVKTPGVSAIRDHFTSTGHAFNIDCFEILCGHSISETLLIQESLYISILKPTLNAQVASLPLHLFQLLFKLFTNFPKCNSFFQFVFCLFIHCIYIYFYFILVYIITLMMATVMPKRWISILSSNQYHA